MESLIPDKLDSFTWPLFDLASVVRCLFVWGLKTHPTLQLLKAFGKKKKEEQTAL